MRLHREPDRSVPDRARGSSSTGDSTHYPCLPHTGARGHREVEVVMRPRARTLLLGLFVAGIVGVNACADDIAPEGNDDDDSADGQVGGSGGAGGLAGNGPASTGTTGGAAGDGGSAGEGHGGEGGEEEEKP